MLAGPDPLVVLHMPGERIQDESLHNLARHRGQADRPVVPRIVLPALLVQPLCWTNTADQLITQLADEVIREDKIYCAVPQLNISPGLNPLGSTVPRCGFLAQIQSFQTSQCAQEASIPQLKTEVRVPMTWQQTQAWISEEKAAVWRCPRPRTPCTPVGKIWFVSLGQTSISLGL